MMLIFKKLCFIILVNLIFLGSSCINDPLLDKKESIRCYNYNIGLAEYYHGVNDFESSYKHLNQARCYEGMNIKHYVIASKIYIQANMPNKVFPLLRNLVHKGYNFESLLREELIGDFIRHKQKLYDSLLKQSKLNIKRLDNLPINQTIDSLFRIDQELRKNLNPMSSQTIIESERGVVDELVNILSYKNRIPLCTVIGFERQGKLFVLLMHHFPDNSEEGILIRQLVNESYVNQNFTASEYALFLDKLNLVKTGNSKFSSGMSFSSEGEMGFGYDVENIEKIDSLRFHELGLFPLKFQGNLFNQPIVSDYNFQIFSCPQCEEDLSAVYDTMSLKIENDSYNK